jgi:hypothetical protein
VLLLWIKPGSKVWTFSRYFTSVLSDPNHMAAFSVVTDTRQFESIQALVVIA